MKFVYTDKKNEEMRHILMMRPDLEEARPLAGRTITLLLV